MQDVWKRFVVWGQGLHPLPFCNLKSAKKHRFGTLRLGPKVSSIQQDQLVLPGEAPGPVANGEPYTWLSLRWRPLVAYSSHHWRKLLTLLCRWCMYAIASFGLGFSVCNPRYVAQMLREVNTKFRNNVRDVSATYDGETFFNHVPREAFARIVKYYAARHLRKEPDEVYRGGAWTRIYKQVGRVNLGGE